DVVCFTEKVNTFLCQICFFYIERASCHGCLGECVRDSADMADVIRNCCGHLTEFLRVHWTLSNKGDLIVATFVAFDTNAAQRQRYRTHAVWSGNILNAFVRACGCILSRGKASYRQAWARKRMLD